MKRAALLPSILLAASVFLAPMAHAAGMIVIDPITPGPTPLPVVPVVPVHPVHPHPGTPTPAPTHPTLHGSVSYGLRLQSADVKVDIADNVAKTYVTQVFANDTDRNVAGTYLFPLPDDTTFSSFSLTIDGKPVEGKILEANEARAEYESIVRRVIDPGLLEYADYKTVRARIFPIPAHGTKKVELEYTQLLKAENGMLKYRFPLKTEGAEEAEELKVAVKLNSKQGLRTIWSPSHTIATKRDDDHHAKVEFDAKNATPDKDFFLYYSVSDKDLAANLVANKNADEDGFYLLSLTPPVESKEVAAKDIVLVTDTSGSMAGDRLNQSKQALKYIVNALGPDDRFGLVKFDTDVDSLNGALLPATAENKNKAIKYIDELEARGGTNIGDALKTGLTMLDTADDASARPAFMVLMTDGEPTVGETTVPGLLKTLANKRDVRLFDFGVGYDVNTRLLDRLAQEHHGTAHYIEPDESFETSLSNFYGKIQKPVLTDVKIAYDGVDVSDVYPREVKDIFAGSQVLLLGRYKVGGAATVKLTGTLNGAQKSYTFPVKFADSDVENSYLPRMWAMRRIAHLTDVAKDNGDSREVVDEIVALSKKYGIISAYTSFLATDPNEPNGADWNADGGAWRTASVPVNMGLSLRPAGAIASGGGGGMSAPVSGLAPTRLDSFVFNSGKSVHQHYAQFAAKPAAPSTSLTKTAAVYGDEGEFATAGGDFAWTNKIESGPTRGAAWTFPAGDTGEKAVKRAKKKGELEEKEVALTADQKSGIKTVQDKTFYLRDGFWVDSAWDQKHSPKPIEITFGSKEYFDLLKTPGLAKYLAIGRQVIFTFEGKAYKISYKQTA